VASKNKREKTEREVKRGVNGKEKNNKNCSGVEYQWA